MASIKKNYLYNIIYQFLLLLLPLITVPYITRILGPYNLGLYAYTNSIAQYFVILIMMGVNLYGSRQIARVRDDLNKLKEEFSEIVSLQIINTVIFITIYFVYTFYVYLYEYDKFSITIIWSIYVLSAAFDITWLFAGMENFKIIVIRNIFLKILVVISIFIFVTDESSLFLYVLLMSVGTLFSQIVLWLDPITYNSFKLHIKRKTYLKHFTRCFTLFIPVISVSIYTIVDKVMLGYLTTYEQLAFFDNSQKIITIPLALITSLGNVMLPRITNMLAKDEDDIIGIYIEKTMLFTSISSIGFICLIVVIAPDFSKLFFGDKFVDCGNMIKCLSITIPFITWSNVIRMQYLIPKNMDYAYVLAVLFGALLNIILNLILIPHYYAYGAIMATIGTEICVAIIQTYFAKSGLPLSKFLYSGSFYIIPGIASCLCMELVRCWLDSSMTGIVLYTFLGLAVYILGSFILLKKQNIFNGVFFRR